MDTFYVIPAQAVVRQAHHPESCLAGLVRNAGICRLRHFLLRRPNTTLTM